MYRETYSKSEWAIRDNDDAPKDAIGQLLFPLPVALCDDTMKIVITNWRDNYRGVHDCNLQPSGNGLGLLNESSCNF